MKKKVIFIVICLVITFKTNYAFTIEPDVFIQSTVNRAAATLGGNYSKEERIEKLKQIAEDTVDIEGISLYSLGSYRKQISNERLIEYKKVFRSYFLKSFSSRLAEYTNPEIDVYDKKKINENYTIVHSKLLGTETRPEVKIDWRVYTKNPDNLLIRDLIIEGLSLARTQKEEFSSIINSNNNNIEALIKNLGNFSNQ